MASALEAPTRKGIRSMSVHLIAGLPAMLVIARHDGGVLVLVDAEQPWRRILGLARALLPHHERLELLRALVA